MNAIKLTLVAYVISVKRTSAVMSVLFGWFIFREEGIQERLMGVTIMVIGVLFMALPFNQASRREEKGKYRQRKV